MFDGITDAAWTAKWDYLYYWLPCYRLDLMGLMLSSYFSAILSTADSCLMAASGNIVTDIIAKKRVNA
jgi:SSS family solute:Na+ symporter